MKGLEDKLTPDLDQIDNWCDNNHMLVNTSKTNAMLKTTWQKLSKLTDVYLKGKKD